MGKVFLIAIGVGLVFFGIKLKGIIWKERPSRPVSVVAPSRVSSPVDPGSLRRPSEDEPLPVLASCSEFLQIQHWGIVRRGDALPGGFVLVSWSSTEAVCRSGGVSVRRRFRRFEECETVQVLPASSPVPVVASSVTNWPPVPGSSSVSSAVP